jgi:hypothetical protein
MMRLWLAELDGEGLVIELLAPLHGDPTGGMKPQLAEIGQDDLVLLSRRDYDLELFDVPPVPQKELAGLLAYRLRAVHPGAPQSTLFDYRRGDAPDDRLARVYVIRRDVKERYEELAMKGVLASSDLLCTAALPNAGHLVLALLLPRYAEVIELRRGRLCSSRVVEIDRTGPAGFRSELVSLLSGFSEEHEMLVVSKEPEAAHIVARELGSVSSTRAEARTLDFSQLLEVDHGARGRIARMLRLFEPSERRRRRDANTIRTIAVIVLLFASAMLYPLYGYRSLRSHNARLDAARNAYMHLEQTRAGRTQEAQKLASAQQELQKLRDNRPSDVYGFFASIARSASTSVQLGDVTLNGNAFTVQGTVSSRNASAFSLAENLASAPSFHDVHIVQLVPIQSSNMVQFTIAGEYDGR